MDIYSKIGFKGLVKVVWKSSNIFSFPYGLYAYHNIFKKSKNLEDVLSWHEDRSFNSNLFRLLKPKYYKVKKVLKEYEVE